MQLSLKAYALSLVLEKESVDLNVLKELKKYINFRNTAFHCIQKR